VSLAERARYGGRGGRGDARGRGHAGVDGGVGGHGGHGGHGGSAAPRDVGPDVGSYAGPYYIGPEAAQDRAILVAQAGPPTGLAIPVAESAGTVAESGVPVPAVPTVLAELDALTRSAGALVCAHRVLPRLRPGHPVAATFIGKGQARALGELVKRHRATVVIFDHAVTPIQERNLEKILQCRALDRTGLILDIFAQRATSSEGKLQVELAQLRHLSTRLVRGWSHLERQKGGVGLRGPGETQLETDRRLIGARIKSLARRLQRVESQRALRRRGRRRAALPTVSLAGYTNAGKSSLFNRLTGAGVPAADRLFATLDPTMRQLALPGFGAAVLSDTVGFIRDLPHTLVAAFHSTLEEMASAACIVLVNDTFDPNRDEQRHAVQKVLEEIGAAEVPVIQVNNKIDLSGDAPRAQRGPDGRIGAVWLSAHSGAGIDLLRQALAETLGCRRRPVVLDLKPQAGAAGALRAHLYRRCEVVDEVVDSAGRIRLKLNMENADRGWLEAQTQFKGVWSVRE